ncbi:MAG: THUMP domain-containing protein [Armatimonadota bacterium]|jgi:23S rRNA G2445 N2-methylase RlmL
MPSPRYYVTVVGGLEEVAWGELQEALLEPRLAWTERGRVFFDCASAPRELLALRSVENVHAYVGEFGGITAEDESLEHIRERVAELSLDDQVAMYESVAGAKPDPSFRVTGHRAGTHEFNSMQIAAYAGAGVIDRYGWRVDLTGHDLEVRADVRQDTCLVGLRLSDESLSRRSRVEHGPASLKSTVAYCMIRLVGWGETDVFLDPMCGAGTILVERGAVGPARLLVGGDRDGRSLEKAATNLRDAGCDADLLRWDARRVPLARGSVDRMVCNLPWGRRVGSHRVNVHLYPAFVRELGWLLAEGGRAALLTAEKRLITRLIHREARLTLSEVRSIRVGGLRTAIYVVTRA